MSAAMFPLMFIAFAGITVLLVVLGYLAARKRREAMAAFAGARGWRYVAEDPRLVSQWDGVPFGQGHSRRASNVLYGTHDGRSMVAFDYQFTETTGSGKNRHSTTYEYSVVVLGTGVPLPRLSVTPQNIVSGFFGRLTNSDIELESEDFNRAFVVSSDSRKFASDVLHPRTMELLLQVPQLGWRFVGDSMLCVRSGQHTPAEVDAKLAHLDAILDSVPEFVWREVRGQ